MNVKKEILKYVKNKKDGFTINVEYNKDKNILNIYDLSNNIFDKDIYRYCVAITNNDNKDKIDKLLNEIANKSYNGIIGGWYNKDNDKCYIDKVIVTSNKNYAIQLGKKYKQISIYDLKTKKELKINY
jgi:hypothetical protein